MGNLFYGRDRSFSLLQQMNGTHDADEWLGIYVSKRQQGKPSDRAVAWWNEEQKQGVGFYIAKELRCLSILLWMTDLGKWNEKS